ncbi:hypothetical protein [Brevundimonas sp. GCM10030266]|uniref:hypothetical protein n=1 Tax=Brevundimonas sp. GCM10030266 TaxID=3273386 RepID=UPI003621CE2A
MTALPDYCPFEVVERLTFDTKKCGADIRLSIQPEGVVWATSAHRRHGNFSGYAEPLGRWGTERPSRCAPDRLSAIEQASARIRRHDADPEVLAWLDTLIPDQPDLFQGSDQ